MRTTKFLKMIIILIAASALIFILAGCNSGEKPADTTAATASLGDTTALSTINITTAAASTEPASVTFDAVSTATPPKTTEPVIYPYEYFEKIYKARLKEYYHMLQADGAEIGDDNVPQWLFEAFTKGYEAVNDIGYGIVDLCGDYTPELFIGYNYYSPQSGSDSNERRCSEIVALYTIVDGEVVLLFDGVFRNHIVLQGFDNFLNYQSLSAFDIAYEQLHFSADSRRLNSGPYKYHTHSDRDGVSYYKTVINEDGVEIEKEVISEDAFLEAVAIYDAPDSHPFMTLLNAVNTWEEYYNGLGVLPHDDLPDGSAEYVEFIIDDGEFSRRIALLPYNVQNLKIYDIEFDSVDESGNIYFSGALLHTVDTSKPLVLQLDFPGSIPGVGLTFTDSEGVLRNYAIFESRLDSGIVLSEINLLEQ